MNDELDDAQEWADITEALENTEYGGGNVGIAKEAEAPSGSKRSRDNSPGQPTQYAMYGSGYTATTPTVSKLPPGCYDIHADSKCIYVTPALKPSGILLELPEMRSDDVIRIVETFWNSEDDYKIGNEFVIGGAAFKAGIMIYGPPGSGKSCTIKLVSKRLVERGGMVFYASGSPSSISSFLADFARVESDRKSIVILEDFDSLISRYGEAEYLEILDSAKTINNVLFIATTNYPERLDPRVYNRPGRFSHVIKIGLPTPKAREAYLKNILKNHRDVEEIVSKTDKFTIDHLTALINAVYREKKDLHNEIERLKTLFKVPKSEDRPLGIGVKHE